MDEQSPLLIHGEPRSVTKVEIVIKLSMRALMFLALLLVNIALLIHLTEKVLGFRKRRRNNKLLVNNHPEMKSVDPEQGLMAFESDDVTRAFVLDNDEPGTSEPFLVSSDEETDE